MPPIAFQRHPRPTSLFGRLGEADRSVGPGEGWLALAGR
jgi:hypothetical protein